MKRHYPRIITACCFLFLFVNVGLPSTSFSVYQPYLVELVGDEGGSLILSVRTLVSLAAMFFVNHWYNRLDCRLAVTFGCLLTAVGFFLYGLATSLPAFLLAAAFAGLGYGLGGVVGSTLLIGRWYKARVGTALGIAAVGSGVAGMVLPPAIAGVIHGVSLSAAFLAEGALAAVVAALVFALVRNRPSDLGLRPYGQAQMEAARAAVIEANGGEAGDAGITLSRGERAAMVLAMVFVGVVCVGALAYLSILFTTNGFSEGFAAGMLSLFGVCLMASKFGVGVVFDRVGIARGSLVVFGAAVLGVALCCLAPLRSTALAVAAFAFFGLGTSLGSTCISAWSLHLSRPSTRARTVRDFQVGYSVGGFLGDSFPGFLAGATGSYVPTFGLVLVTTAIAAVIVCRVCARHEG